MSHLATAFENDALIDAQTWGEDISSENGGVMDLHPVLSPDAAVDFATDDDGACFDLTLYARAFANDQGIGGEDFSAKRATNTNGALKTELSFKLTTMIDDAGDGRMGGGNA